MSEETRKKAYVAGNVLLNIIKWIVLIFSVLYVGLTIGLIVAAIIYGDSLATDTLVKFTTVLLPYNKVDVDLFVTNYGMGKVLVASCGYAVANSINNIIIYALVSRSIKLYKEITIGDVFSRKSYDLAGELLSISFMMTFLMPIMLFILSTTTNMFLDVYVTTSFAGLFFIAFAGVVRIIVGRGLSIVRENSKFDRTIDDYKADIDELKIQSIKREAELKELKKLVAADTKKQPTKKVVKKEVKADDDKKKKSHHSRTKKTGTTTK